MILLNLMQKVNFWPHTQISTFKCLTFTFSNLNLDWNNLFILIQHSNQRRTLTLNISLIEYFEKLQNSRCEMRCGVWRDSFAVFLQVPVILFVSWDARNTNNKERDTCPEVTISPPVLRPQPPGGRWAPDSTWWQMLVMICLNSALWGIWRNLTQKFVCPPGNWNNPLKPKKMERKEARLAFSFRLSSCRISIQCWPCERLLDGDDDHEGEVGEDPEAAQAGEQDGRHPLLL